MEAHHPVDRLEDPSADAFATWLGRHPGTEIICRDRAGTYAESAARGAPQALQVADRWHLLAKLGAALEPTNSLLLPSSCTEIGPEP